VPSFQTKQIALPLFHAETYATSVLPFPIEKRYEPEPLAGSEASFTQAEIAYGDASEGKFEEVVEAY
jgi:hypothetical protein